MKSGGDSFEHGRMLLELQTTKKQLNEAVKKVDQAMKDADYYHGEAENMRGRYNDILLDKQRLEQVISKYSKKKVFFLLIFVIANFYSFYEPCYNCYAGQQLFAGRAHPLSG